MTRSGDTSLLEHAISLGRQRRYREAVPLLQRIASSQNGHTEALLYLGRSYHALGDFSQAIDSLRQFVELHPDSAAGHFFLGRSFLSAGAFLSAARQLQQALRLKPDFSHSRVLLAYAFLKLKKADEASDLLGQVVEADPSNKSLYSGYLNALLVSGIRHFQQGDYDYSREVFEFLLQKNMRDILLYLYLGMIYRSTGELESALNAYEEALLFSPSDELILYRTAVLNIQLGNEDRGRRLLQLLQQYAPSSPLLNTEETEHAMLLQYLQREEYSKALAHGLELLKQDRNNIPVRLVVAECCRELDHLEWSVNHYTRAVEQDPFNIHAHFGLAMIWWQSREYSKMERQLNLIIKTDPHNESARYYRILCRSRMNIEPSIFIEELSGEIRHFGPDPHLLQALADTYLKDGSYRYAEKWYRKALSLAPENAESLKNLILLSDHIEIVGLEDLYQQYLQLHPRDTAINRRYIRYLFQLEKYPETIEQIESILPFIDDTHWLNRIRAISYRRTGEFGHAAVIYRQLLRQDPEKEEYLRPLVYCLQKSGDNDQAVRILAAAIDHLPEPSAELFLIFGVIQFKRDNMNAALRAFRDAQDKAPGDWRPYHNIGEVYRRRGMEDYASRFFLRAEKLKTSNAAG